MKLRQGVLYISYDGMAEPLGQSQVLAYLEKLGTERPIHLVSFEKPDDLADGQRMAAVRTRIEAVGISWTPLRYHKRPTAPATAFDIANGIRVGTAITLRNGIEVVHARSYVAAAMALPVKRLTGARFLFDMRGFWADERVEGGLWPANSRLYRIVKRLERRFLCAADHVVTLTHASVSEIRRLAEERGETLPITVIPTCADLERFDWPAAPKLREDAPLTFGYVGSVGTWYLFDEVLRFFRVLRSKRPGSRLLIVNRGEHERIVADLARLGVDPDVVELLSASHTEVPTFIHRMDAAAAIIKPVYSKTASAPTKLAEYLGCGVPCVGNTGVGDMASILEGERVGVTLDDFSEADHNRSADRLLALLRDSELKQRCRDVATERFSLDRGVSAYAGIYRVLMSEVYEPHVSGSEDRVS